MGNLGPRKKGGLPNVVSHLTDMYMMRYHCLIMIFLIRKLDTRLLVLTGQCNDFKEIESIDLNWLIGKGLGIC